MATKSNGTSSSKSEKVTSIKHTDKRANIPTEELRDFVAKDEQAPTNLLYPRDTSLDPQLVWKGKDEQDRADLQVPVVPIYIQEKIHPQAIIDDLLQKQEEAQLNLFSDFNGGPKAFEQKIDFYHHEQNWTNRLILGDSLLVMNSLAEKEGLRGKVQTIFLDPPYGIKFGSNWQVSTRKKEVKDSKAEDTTRQPEQIRAFRDTWKLGIHSYLSYLRDRLTVSRDLLTNSGSIFVQIGDENVHLVRNVLDEVFGSENFVQMITFRKSSGLSGVADYVLWYSRDKENLKRRTLYSFKKVGDGSFYTYAEEPDGTRRRLTTEEKLDTPDSLRIFRLQSLTSAGFSENSNFDFEFDGRSFKQTTQHWKTTKNGMQRLAWANRVMAPGTTPQYVRYYDDFPVQPLDNVWTDTGGAGDLVYVVQTANKIIERCILMSSDPGDLVIDPTCGSGTTAVVAEQWGRRWITCDTSRVSLALARTRLMSSRFPAYLLSDTAEGKKKEQEVFGSKTSDLDFKGDVRKGFVYKRVQHVTLKSIANNEAIVEGLSREQVDSVIANNAEFELLLDQPYEVSSRLRICGPFSVESLSPHRVLSVADGDTNGTVTEIEAKEQQDFSAMILDNLKRAGVQNTIKNERLNFTQLDAFAGRWISAIGTYEDADGVTKRAAISIGPEHGTVGPEQVKEAAKEAVQGVGFDLLIVCGFAFDPHVAEESKRYGTLTVLPTKMNPDLAMGDELLKKTGAGNLFMVFGEPDTEVKRGKDGSVIVTLIGLDIYDPTTGSIRSSSTDDIACWFLDTNYNGESFFVRHAYFLGADKPMEKLKKALKEDINAEAWESLYSNVSRPFPAPSTGKIAIKVINHYGDEVLKVFEVM